MINGIFEIILKAFERIKIIVFDKLSNLQIYRYKTVIFLNNANYCLNWLCRIMHAQKK